MEDIINKIIQIEQTAQSITREAEQVEAGINDEIAREVAAIEEKYRRDAEAKLAQIRQKELEDDKRVMAQNEITYAKMLKEAEAAWEQSVDGLIDAITRRIIEGVQ